MADGSKRPLGLWHRTRRGAPAPQGHVCDVAQERVVVKGARSEATAGTSGEAPGTGVTICSVPRSGPSHRPRGAQCAHQGQKTKPFPHRTLHLREPERRGAESLVTSGAFRQPLERFVGVLATHPLDWLQLWSPFGPTRLRHLGFPQSPTQLRPFRAAARVRIRWGIAVISLGRGSWASIPAPNATIRRHETPRDSPRPPPAVLACPSRRRSSSARQDESVA